MGKLKEHFHEAICALDGRSLRDLRAANEAAWDGYRALIQALPVYRTIAQQRQIDEARDDAENAKWALETAQFWNQYSGRRS